MSNVISLCELTPDPNNAREHTERNVVMIEASLREVGAARSIVIDEDGVVLAGNATLEAAQRAGITKARVIDVDGNALVAVRRTGLTRAQKTRLALFDNRAAELAHWNNDAIADLSDDVTRGILSVGDFGEIGGAKFQGDDVDKDGRHDHSKVERSDVTVVIGWGREVEIRFMVERSEWDSWIENVRQAVGFNDKAVIAEIRRRLEL